MKNLRVRLIVARHELLHKLPLIPDAWVDRACDRYDARLSGRKRAQR